jgi:hypothetical protein
MIHHDVPILPENVDRAREFDRRFHGILDAYGALLSALNNMEEVLAFRDDDPEYVHAIMYTVANHGLDFLHLSEDGADDLVLQASDVRATIRARLDALEAAE